MASVALLDPCPAPASHQPARPSQVRASVVSAGLKIAHTQRCPEQTNPEALLLLLLWLLL